MRTLVMGKEVEWSPEIQERWDLVVGGVEDDRGPVTMANYWHPKPYVDEYNRGRATSGFTYTVNHLYVWQVTL